MAGHLPRQSCPLALGMDRNELISRPDLHRAQPLSHLDDATHPLPVDPVARSLPADEAVPDHLPVLPKTGRQCIPAGAASTGETPPRLTYLRRPYPGNSTMDIQHGPLPNGTVSDKVSEPESGLTLNMAIWPESWPAE